MFRKTITQNQIQRTLASGESITLNSPWIYQPTQGMEYRVRDGLDAKRVMDPVVSWRIQAGISQNSLGFLSVDLTENTESMIGEVDQANITKNVTSTMLANYGEIQASVNDETLTQWMLVVTNHSASPLLVTVRQTISGSFAPHRAPAEVADADGYGYLSTVAYPQSGVTLRDQIPGKSAQPNGDVTITSLQADYPEGISGDMGDGEEI